MDVLVDTPIWSLAYRRAAVIANPAAGELAHLIRDGRAVLIGPIRQEVLSGIREAAHFEILRDALRAFPDLLLGTSDYESAATFLNRCRARGVQGSHINFLICAVASRRRMSIFTTDKDFDRFARILPIRLHPRKRRVN